MKIYCRIITSVCSPAAEKEVKAFLQSALGIVPHQALIPYWKNPSQGELSFSFSPDKDLSGIRALLADRWEADTADSRWSTVYCPMTTFIWLSQ